MRTDTDTLIDAGKSLATPIRIEEGTPFLVRGGSPVSLESYCQKPMRTRGVFSASCIESARAYITRMREHELVVFWDPPLFGKRGQACAIIDFHGKDGKPGWCEHLVLFKCTREELAPFHPIPTYIGKFTPPQL